MPYNKRQIMSILTIIITVYVSIQPMDAFGISSFGKANTEPPRPPTTTPLPGRQCTRQSDCGGITSSSCVRTHYDSTTRCLCGDNTSPINGKCNSDTKYLYHVCSKNDDCNEGLICGSPNITSSSPSYLHVFSPQEKICLCDSENGFKEKEHTCSDADILKTSVFAVLIVTCIRKMVVY